MPNSLQPIGTFHLHVLDQKICRFWSDYQETSNSICSSSLQLWVLWFSLATLNNTATLIPVVVQIWSLWGWVVWGSTGELCVQIKISIGQARKRAKWKSLLWCAFICSEILPSEQPHEVDLLPNVDFFGLFSKSLTSQGVKLAQQGDNYKEFSFRCKQDLQSVLGLPCVLLFLWMLYHRWGCVINILLTMCDCD